ncbi:MAG: SPOR domain-containing protein [Odoribacteraceae bacterium]|jgi:cell division septation protein DedD|nr:SPOR domain-containing protein [Odoribacteraceae bacterium]
MKIIVPIILAAAVVAGCQSRKKMYAAPFDNEDDQVVVVTDTRTTLQPTQTTTTTTTAPRDNSPIRVQQERVTISHGTSTKRFHVIVGSFSNEENAIRLRNKLNSDGYVSIIMLNEARMNRVSVAGFDDETSAREELRRIRGAYPEYQDAWLLVMQ